MLTSDPNVLNESKIAWREKSKSIEPPTRTVPLTFMEHLAWLFLRILCASQSCKKGYEQDNDDRNDVNIQRIRIKSQDARSTRMETNAIFFLVFLVSFSPIWIVYWLIYWVRRRCLYWYPCIPFTNRRVSVATYTVPVATKDLLQ